MSGVREGLSQSVSILDMKIMVLDEFKEELGESKAISLAYEDGLDELFYNSASRLKMVPNV